MITLTWNSLGILVSVLNYAAWPFLLPAFQYCHPGQISLSSVLWFHLSFPSANWFDKVFSRWQIQFSESDEYSRKKKKKKNQAWYMPQWVLHVCLIYWRVKLEAQQVWVNADLYLLEHDIGSPFLIHLTFAKRMV